MMHVFMSMDISENVFNTFSVEFFDIDMKIFKVFVVFFFFLYLMNFQFFLMQSTFGNFLVFLFWTMKEFMKQIGGFRLLGFYHLMLSLIIVLLVTTLSGFLPLLAPLCVHPGFVWTLFVPIWLCTVYMCFKASFFGFLMTLNPAGVPLAIAPAMFFFEVVSLLIRPVSLSLRLMANMVVGHILFSWHWREVALSIGNILMLHLVPSFGILGFMLMNCFHLLWEMAVCIFQSFVAVGLLSLYSNDVIKSKYF